MKLHEYQAKALLKRYGVNILEGGAATTPGEAVEAAHRLGGPIWVVKSQIHAGGRGKGRFKEDVDADAIAAASRGDDAPGKGGVRLARSIDDVREAALSMLGKTLVTKQTGPEGKIVRTLFIEDGCAIDRELYLSILLDRSNNKVLFMASQAGGMDIEDVAHDHPEQIIKLWVDPGLGFADFQGRELAKALGITGSKSIKSAIAMFKALYNAYMDLDCSMLEINPLVVTKTGELVVLDAKVDTDGNASFRHAEYATLRDLSEEDPMEIEAGEWNLSFIKLDGNIGCLVNGAGLAMATMDIIQYKGAKPANFLDVGGGANQEQVTAAFRIITRDPAVEGILVNIFGGIMKCDVIANGVIGAVKEVGLQVPLVVRLSGTNSELGKEILNNASRDLGLKIVAADNLDDAAEAIVAAVRKG